MLIPAQAFQKMTFMTWAFQDTVLGAVSHGLVAESMTSVWWHILDKAIECRRTKLSSGPSHLTSPVPLTCT